MDMTALLLSRIQFAFTITFHIIFPSFTIGLAAWLTVLEVLRLATETTRNRLPKCIIPFVITVDEAAAPQSSLAFMFWGAG
jgi:cytochrome bd-type quinol oxidase subunit 1